MNHRGHREHRDEVERALEGETFKAIDELLDIEIEQESDLTVGKPEIGEYLRAMNRLDRLYRFEFNDDEILNQKVNAETTI